jgi:hypothetical protein
MLRWQTGKGRGDYERRMDVMESIYWFKAGHHLLCYNEIETRSKEEMLEQLEGANDLLERT